MRRVVIAALLLAVVLGLACLSLIDLYDGTDRLAAACEAVKATESTADSEQLVSQSESLRLLWEELEGRFVLYVRHDHLDLLTSEIARLPMLGRYNERGAYFCGIDNILAVLDDIRRSAVPSYRNLL